MRLARDQNEQKLMISTGCECSRQGSQEGGKLQGRAERLTQTIHRSFGSENWLHVESLQKVGR